MVVAGYTILHELFRSRKRAVYRAKRDSDGASVILKTIADQVHNDADVLNLRREHEILTSLNIDGVPSVLALESNQRGPVLVLEDIGAEPLLYLMESNRIIPNSPFVSRNPDHTFDLNAFLNIAIALTSTLAELHRNHVIHKDINPKNIVLNLKTGKIQLIDFSIASRLPRLDQNISHPALLEGTLAYMSPEQTGRMNRSIDYRCDFYSLGVTFYEMLTGRLPFASDDPLELVHRHIAKIPEPPESIRPEIPKAISGIIMKLLSKTAEERYSSGVGLKADLEHCLHQIRSNGTIGAFVPGTREISDRFNIPQKLYGRAEEIRTLIAGFERVCNGSVEMMLVAGYSGIGKTSLIHEVQKPIVRHKGYFTAGKFDQLNRVVPYSALIQSLQELVRQLLTENTESIAGWKTRLLKALGNNGQVIIDVIPEVELILGPQAAVPALSPTESQNRFNLVFRNFIGVFADAEHPLAIFLDDLQWADSATLNLIQILTTHPDVHYLFFIGAYRDNETGDSHPLMLSLAQMKREGARLNTIVLQALSSADLNQLIADTLKCDALSSAPLADLVMNKTLGNPFFATQFLIALYQERLLEFDYRQNRWEFNLQQIRNRQMTDNVVDLMASKIQNYSESTRQALMIAACIGNRFDLATLSRVLEKPSQETAEQVRPAVQEGLLLPLGNDEFISNEFKFLHDRVQQAAYTLIPEERRKEVRLNIGQLMLTGSSELEIESRIFDIVNHMNFGSELLRSPSERLTLALLNVKAGSQAKQSAAYEAALGYFKVGIQLLPTDSWNTEYELSFKLHLEASECEYLCGLLETAEASFHALLNHAISKLDKCKIYILMILQYENGSRYQEAISIGQEALQLLGLTFPSQRADKQAALEREIASIDALIGGRRIDELIALPAVTDPEIQMVLKLLSNLHTSCYLSGDEPLTLLNTVAMVRLSLEHGNTEASAYGYVLYASLFLGPIRMDHKSAYEFGVLAQKVNDRFYNPVVRARVLNNFSWAISIWRKPIDASFEIAREAFRLANENGLFVEATYSLFNESKFYLLSGKDLATFAKTYQSNVEYNRRVKMHQFAGGQQALLQWGNALRGATEYPTSFTNENFDEDAFRELYKGQSLFEMFYFVGKLAVLYTFGKYEAALLIAREAERVIQDFTGTIWDELTVYYKALVLAQLYANTGEEEQAQLHAELVRLNSRLQHWAENSPYMFQLQYLIVSAEIARIEGKELDAIHLFETSIERAKDFECPRERALANELLGKLWLQKQNSKVAGVYIAEAYAAYSRWGAAAKVHDLESQYPYLMAQRETPGATSSFMTAHSQASTLDTFAVVKAAQAISSEIILERLQQKLILIVMENAGAQRVLLFQEKDGEDLIQAEGSIDRIDVLQSIPAQLRNDFSRAILNYVKRTGESIVLTDASRNSLFANDPYILEQQPKSVMCVPVLHQSKRIGILYLENNLVVDAFTPERIQIVQTLSSQSAISLENARLYSDMKQEIAQRKLAEEALRTALSEIEELKNRLQAENVYLQEEIRTQHNFEQIVGVSLAIKRVFQNIEKVAGTSATVLVTGETGTGKELVARAIHNLSKRKESVLITVNCAALPGGLIESELFGHERGAFTGATARKKGRFELADGGSIFLDEVGEIPLETQTKLLRVLQEQEFERVGGSQTLHIDVRVIAATNRDLQEVVKVGAFRADLFYRLNIFPITLPSLRERREDIPLLTGYFVNKFSRRMGKKIDRVSPSAQDLLLLYDWPGNVRELANVLERAVILCDGGVLQPEQITISPSESAGISPIPTLEESERSQIVRALDRSRWVVGGPSGAARLLGLNRTTLIARMKRLGIEKPKIN